MRFIFKWSILRAMSPAKYMAKNNDEVFISFADFVECPDSRIRLFLSFRFFFNSFYVC